MSCTCDVAESNPWSDKKMSRSQVYCLKPVQHYQPPRTHDRSLHDYRAVPAMVVCLPYPGYLSKCWVLAASTPDQIKEARERTGSTSRLRRKQVECPDLSVDSTVSHVKYCRYGLVRLVTATGVKRDLR